MNEDIKLVLIKKYCCLAQTIRYFAELMRDKHQTRSSSQGEHQTSPPPQGKHQTSLLIEKEEKSFYKNIIPEVKIILIIIINLRIVLPIGKKVCNLGKD